MSAIRPTDVVFDIGANVGAYCVPIAKANPGVRIYAFEPIPLNAALIDASLQMNGLQNVKIVRSCVSDETGTVQFSLAEDSAYSSMLDTHRKAEIRRFDCPTITLDEFATTELCAAPGIIKVDVEGAELKVLKGSASIFGDPGKRPRLVLVELYDQNLVVFGPSIPEVTALMRGWDYKPYVLIDGQKVPFTERHHNLHYNVFFEA
jgi:FkbM family methyltransferase